MPQIDTLALSALLALRHPQNPKEHNLSDLVESFQRFGFVAFPTLDEATRILVAGHGRCEALALMRSQGHGPPRGIAIAPDGDWLVPVIRGVSFESEKERDAYIIADNQHTIAGGWSFDKLTDWVKSFGSSATDDGFRGLGFQSMELDSLLGNFSQPEELPDEEEQSSGEETVSNDIDVTLNVKCPNCSHEWSVEKRKRKPKKSVSLKNAV